MIPFDQYWGPSSYTGQVDCHARFICFRSNVFDIYPDDLCIIGVEPTPQSSVVLWTCPLFLLHSLGWYEIMRRPSSATAEIIFLIYSFGFIFPKFHAKCFSTGTQLIGQVTFRANNFRKSYMKDNKAFEATSAESKKNLTELLTLLGKKLSNAKRQEEDMRLGSPLRLSS